MSNLPGQPTYPGENDSHMPSSLAVILLFIVIFSSVGFVIFLGFDVYSTVTSEEYKQGYNDAVNSKSDVYTQLNNIDSSNVKSVRYIHGYENGLKKAQQNTLDQSRKSKNEQSEKVLNEYLNKNNSTTD